MVRPSYQWPQMRARTNSPGSSIAFSLLHPNCLYIREFANSVGAQLAAHPRTLHAAKRNPGVGKHHLIDEDHAGFEFADEPLLFAFVVRPGAGAEAEPAVIGYANCFID